MIRKSVQFVLMIFCLCLCAFVCDDNPIDVITVAPGMQGLTDSSANLDTLLSIVPDILAPNIAGEVTDLTPEVWEKLKFNREFSFNEYKTTVMRQEELQQELSDKDKASMQAWHDREVAKIKFLEVEQPKFYNRYIDADGVSIIGNEKTLDEYFVMARDIFLIMTSKHPRLREPLRDHFYIVITGGFEKYWLSERSDQASPQLTPEHRFIDFYYGFIYSNNTCQTGGLTLDYGPRTASGLVKVRGWCVSHVLHGYDDLINPTHSHPPAGDPLQTFVHEMVHAMQRIKINIDPTFEGRLTTAYEAYLARDPVYPTTIREWWAGKTPRWFFRPHPEYTNPYGLSLGYTTQDFIDRAPLLAELFLQWYPEISLTGMAKHYFGRENF